MPTAETLAEIYDTMNPWGRSDEFYVDLVMSAGSVLDVGCGTGTLLGRARDAGHTGRLTGIDPDQRMLSRARRHTDVEWVEGTAAEIKWDGEFDLAVMASHAFQFLVDDADLRASLAAIRASLAHGGQFAFETRNPLKREWEQWNPSNTYETHDGSGNTIQVRYDVDSVNGDVIHVGETLISPLWDAPHSEWTHMRFLDVNALNSFLTDAGFVIQDQYGGWDRTPFTDTSAEIITVANAG